MPPRRVGGQPFHPIWGLLTRRFFDRWVDPDGGRQIGRLRRTIDEALGMHHVRGGQDHLTMRAHRWGVAEVHDRRREEPEPAVMMVVVVPPKEGLTERAAVGDRSEAVRKLRAVFERPELGFGKRIVVGHVRPAVRFGDAEIGQEQRDGLAPHRGAAVGMQRQLAGLDAVLRAGLGNQALGERRAFGRGQHPADDVAAEDIEDDVEIEIRPLRRAEELGDVPAPDFVGARRQQLGRRVVRAPDLIAPLLDFVRGVEEAIHRPGRAEIGALIEQRGVDLRRRLIDEAGVEQIQHAVTLDGCQRPRRRRSRPYDRGRSTPPIQRGPREAQRATGRLGAHRGGRVVDGDHQSSSSCTNGFRGIPRSSETFFWNAMIASACCNRDVKRRFSSSSFLTRGSTAVVFRPRFVGVNPLRAAGAR